MLSMSYYSCLDTKLYSTSEVEWLLPPKATSFALRSAETFEVYQTLFNSKCLKSSLSADQSDPSVLKLAT